jgi:hypothetical protein
MADVVLLVGNNKLTLCGAALCAIVEKHLRDSNPYTSKESPQIRVSSVRYSGTDGTHEFTVTTDPVAA